jgi:hypothetical protein
MRACKLRVSTPSLANLKPHGHKNVQHTVRYTELSPERFKGFWKDP